MFSPDDQIFKLIRTTHVCLPSGICRFSQALSSSTQPSPTRPAPRPNMVWNADFRFPVGSDEPLVVEVRQQTAGELLGRALVPEAVLLCGVPSRKEND